MNDPRRDDFSRDEGSPDRAHGDGELSAPLGALQHGRLVFASAAGQVCLAAGRMADVPYRASFDGPPLRAWLVDDTLTIQQGSLAAREAANLGKSVAQVRLNPAIPWEIEFRHGVAGLHADLTGLQLRSLDLLEGANHVVLVLARQPGTTFIYISGGLSHGTIRRPSAVGLRLQVSGRVCNLVFEGRRLDSAGGETRLQTPGFAVAVCKVEIDLAGGANTVVVEAASE